jgi:hypothetical protein
MDLADYLRTPAVRRHGAAELSLPVVHIESLDAGTVSWCRDWRAEIRMTDLAADASTAPVTVGAVDFVLVQLSEGYRPVADHLAMLGVREARFGELFEGGQIEPDLDEHDEFCDSMPMFTALLVLDAIVDDLMPRSRLRPWSVAEVIQTMLPTHSGMVAASALDGATGPVRRLVSTRRLDRDWLDVGLTGIPGHPGFLGRATLFTHLDDAHTALSDIADEVFTVRP